MNVPWWAWLIAAPGLILASIGMGTSLASAMIAFKMSTGKGPLVFLIAACVEPVWWLADRLRAKRDSASSTAGPHPAHLPGHR